MGWEEVQVFFHDVAELKNLTAENAKNAKKR
jgi:hypothetical protein